MGVELASAKFQQPELIDLSDDCLIHLFRYLSLGDINAINTTCRRLHRAVVEGKLHRYYSGTRYSDFGLNVRRFHPKPTAYKLDYVKWYLERFGHLMQEIKIRFRFRNGT